MAINKRKECISKRNVIIWGIGALQTDLEGMFEFENVFYYVDDFVRDKNLISVDEKEIFASDRIKEEHPENVVFILCGDEQDEAIAKLRSWGYGDDDYIIGEELLINHPLYEELREKEISVWGTGNTYTYNENDIKEFFTDNKSFIDSDPKESTFDGKPKITLANNLEQFPNAYIIVCSIYYKDIYKNLRSAGLRPGKDFLHYTTAIMLGSLYSRIDAEYNFIDRRKKTDKLLVILAGYKEIVWECVFPRVVKYVPDDIDVCIVTSGLENEKLKIMCSENGWSYMSTIKNHVSLVVNLAVYLHPEAKYIYKMDEDMFLTKGVFETMLETYKKVEQNYEVGFVTPLIPINGYGYVRLLELFDAVSLWEERFGELKYTDCYCHHRTIHDDPQAARFMWGEDNPAMGSIDTMNSILQNKDFMYSICPIRYSIGFILFHRNNWVRMGMLPVPKDCNMGSDEIYICKFCMMQARVMAVAENTVVGHFNYGGPQTKAMEEYYLANKHIFMLNEDD